MNLEKMSEELAKGVKIQEDLSNIVGQLAKKILEVALNREMDSFLEGMGKKKNWTKFALCFRIGGAL